MLRAMAKLNGDDQKTRDIGNRFSQKNTTKQLARAKEAKAMGLTPLAPQEQHVTFGATRERRRRA